MAAQKRAGGSASVAANISVAAAAPQEALIAWARQLGLSELPGGLAALGPGAAFALIGAGITADELGDLVRAQMASILLQPLSAAELGSLLRLLDKLPEWVIGPPLDQAEQHPEVELDLDQELASAKQLIAEIEATRDATPFEA
jgi:hypothetical protein